MGSIVALCGADGTGKTRLLREVERRICDPGVACVSRGAARTERLVEQYWARTFGNERDWVDAGFGNAIALACAVDFWEHYCEEVVPLLTTKRLVICDRYSVCFLSYAMCLLRPEPAAIAILDAIPKPDRIIHIVASDEVIRCRRAARMAEGRVDEFEKEYCQERFISGYSEVYSRCACPITFLDNSGDIEVTFRQLTEVLGLDS